MGILNSVLLIKNHGLLGVTDFLDYLVEIVLFPCEENNPQDVIKFSASLAYVPTCIYKIHATGT
jgi:hypothetical protein